MTEKPEIWVCVGPRCRAVGGDDARAVAKQVAREDGDAAVFERNCFARCELAARPLPAVRVGRQWVLPVTAAGLRQALATEPGESS